MNYCPYCGEALMYQAKFCAKCGKSVAQEPVADSRVLINTLASRLKTNGIIWIVIAAIQLVIGVCGAWWTLVIGVLNLISAIDDLRISKRIRTNPDGLVETYRPLVGPIVILIYNAVAGGVIGVLGSIYYLVFVRGFVMRNKGSFLAMKTQHIHAEQPQSVPEQEPTVDEMIVITEQEAESGTKKEIFLMELQKTVVLSIPKQMADGQMIRLRNLKGTNQKGEPVKRDFYIKVCIRHSDSE